MAQTQDTVLLRDAVAAAKAGNKTQARQLLRQASVHNPNNELVWLWRASLSESPKEATFYLGEVLRVNPNNQKAAAWLARCKGATSVSAEGAKPTPTVAVPPPSGPSNSGLAHPQGAVASRDPGPIRPNPVSPAEYPPFNAGVPPLRQPAFQAQAQRPAVPSEAYRKEEPIARTAAPAPPPAAPAFPTVRTPYPGPTPVPSVRTPFPGMAAPSAAHAAPVITPAAGVLSPLPNLRPEQLQQPVAAVADPPPAPKWTCPFCAYSSDTAHRRCPTCKAITILEDLREVEKNEGVVEKTVRDSLSRLETIPVEQRTFEQNVILALGHLNLREATKAMPYLKLATSQRRNDWAMLGVLDQIQWRKVILVVDDSLTIRKALSNFLEKNEFRVVMAEDGKKALEKLNEVVPDLVLLDITMPNIDGYQVCRTMKDNALTKAVPVVMLSGKDGIFDKVRGKLAGCSDYVTKPFDPESLLKTIRKYVKA